MKLGVESATRKYGELATLDKDTLIYELGKFFRIDEVRHFNTQVPAGNQDTRNAYGMQKASRNKEDIVARPSQ